MTEEFLTPHRHNMAAHYHNPYEEQGARSIIGRFRADVREMLIHMKENHDKYEEGRTFLATSPLRKKIWIAAAMKTLGLVSEHASDNGACVLTLTDKALDKFDALMSHGLK